METLQNFVSDVKAQFAEIDKAISGLDERERELDALISAKSDDFSLTAVQGATIMRVELQQVQEARERAQARPQEMVEGIETAAFESAVRAAAKEMARNHAE